MAIIKSVTNKSTSPATFQEVKHWHETHLHPSVIDFSDPKPYEVYSEGKWAGVFQCLVGETPVKLSDGSSVRLDEINIGNRVISYDECYVISTVVATYDQGIRPCVELTLNKGDKVICTEDHRFLTGRGFRKVSEMFIGETLLSHDNICVHLVSVRPVGLRNVYDIEVEGTHNFIAAGLIAHNCTGQGAQKLFQRCKPKSIIDIAALTSIYRPGPLAAKVDKLWQKHETEPYDWGHPLINDVLKDARGLLIFQEHVMSLANKVSGFPMEQCDEVRRAIMKRSISGGAEAVKKTKELEESIVAGAIKNGVPKDTAKKMYDTICYMSGYGFNRSHAVAYAIDSFWTSYLLTYYEEQWLCAYLESMSTSPGQRAKAFSEVKSLGYEIVPIDINYATESWISLPGKKLMPSLTSCKGLGDSAVEEILANRPYKTIEELLWTDDFQWKHSKFNKRALEALIKVGAFESMEIVGEGRLFKTYRHMYETLLGSHPEVVTKKRKGVETTEEVEIDHSSLIKRSPKTNPHEGLKNFYELVRRCADMPDWTSLERATNMIDVFGAIDVTGLVDHKLLSALEKKGVKTIDDLEFGETAVVWFVATMFAQKKGAKPSIGVIKKTKNGKDYMQIYGMGPMGKAHRISVWGSKQLPDPFTVFCAEVKRDDYGISTTQWKLKKLA